MKDTYEQDLLGKFKVGEIVYAKKDPSLKLIIRRFINNIYYCKIQKDPMRRELVYFERDLSPETITTSN